MAEKYPDLLDEELVLKILKKDKEALGELFCRYHKAFFNLSYRFLGDYRLAEDLTSEIFLRIYKYLRAFDKKAKFRPWAFKVATNVCLTYKKQNSKIKIQKSKIKIKDDEDIEYKEELIPDPEVDLFEEVQKNEVSQRVQASLMKLPEKYRIALYLYFFEDLKYEEIAEDLNLPVNTVRTHIKRGKERMKEELKDLI